MPKLPVINYKKLTKVLKGLDFFEHRQSGSHLIMKHQDGRRAVIPIHSNKDISKGTLKSILKDIEISVDELIKNL